MNILKSLILIISISIVLCKSSSYSSSYSSSSDSSSSYSSSSSSSTQYVVYENFNYLGVCPGQPPSTSSCNSNSNLLESTIYPLNTCSSFQDYFVVFSIEGDKIIEKGYPEPFCTGFQFEKIEYTNGYCNSTCYSNQGASFRYRIIDELEIPSDTYISISYNSSDCNGDYKDGLIQIEYINLNSCINKGYGEGAYSLTLSCNKTASETSFYVGTGCRGEPTLVEANPSLQDCDLYANLNFLQICNQ